EDLLRLGLQWDSIEYVATVDVHVVGHMGVDGRGGGELDRGARFAAIGGPAPSREADDIAATSHLARGRNRVVAGRINEDEALGRDRLRIPVNGVARRRAALGCRTERLLENRREAARLVPGRRVVVHAHAGARRVVLPPLNDLDQLLADLASRGAA